MTKQNNGKTALITGATSGIGAAYANALAEQGFDLLITGRRRDVIEKVGWQIEEKFKVKVNIAIVELSDEKDIARLMEQIKTIGPIDILVNNAGFTSKGFYYQLDLDAEERMVKVHSIAMMKLTHAVLPDMIHNKKGTIINIASVQAVTPMAFSVTYCSVKAFMRNFSLSLHCEVKDHGVKVQCVFPGFTRTDLGRDIGVDMQTIKDKPSMRWMLPEEVARISLHSLRKKNKVICVPGIGNKITYTIARMLPERAWCAAAEKFVKIMP